MSAPQDPFAPPPGYGPPPPSYPHAPYGQPWPPGAGYPGYPPGAGYPGYPPSSATNGFAIASLVLGVLWVYWIGSVLALVFGYVALRQIKQRHEGGRGLAIAGVVLGWVGVVALPLVIMVVFALGSAVKGDFQETCEEFSPMSPTPTAVSC